MGKHNLQVPNLGYKESESLTDLMPHKEKWNTRPRFPEQFGWNRSNLYSTKRKWDLCDCQDWGRLYIKLIESLNLVIATIIQPKTWNKYINKFPRNARPLAKKKNKKKKVMVQIIRTITTSIHGVLGYKKNFSSDDRSQNETSWHAYHWMHIRDAKGPMVSRPGCQTRIHIHFQASALLQPDHLIKKHKYFENVAQAERWEETGTKNALRRNHLSN